MALRTLRSRIDRLTQAKSEGKRWFAPDCICFPENEQPGVSLPAEREAVASVLCSLHGKRFTEWGLTPYFSTGPGHWRCMWTSHSAQYKKAMAASFPCNLWPAVGTMDHEGTLRFLLKDGTEIKRQKLLLVSEEDDNLHVCPEDRRRTYLGLHPNGRTILGPRRGSQELVYLTEDEDWFSRSRTDLTQHR